MCVCVETKKDEQTSATHRFAIPFGFVTSVSTMVESYNTLSLLFPRRRITFPIPPLLFALLSNHLQHFISRVVSRSSVKLVHFYMKVIITYVL